MDVSPMIINPPFQQGVEQSYRYYNEISAIEEATILLPLGGCGEFGRNMTALICDQELFFLDCGILFPQDTHFGLTGILYDPEPLIHYYGHPKAYVITHAHRDHVGGLLYFLESWPAPVYATPWTIECIEGDIQRFQSPEYRAYLRSVEIGEQFQVGGVNFEYISVNHSIPESCALFIETAYHRIAHSGDFKIDRHSSLEKPANLIRWQELAQERPFDIFLCDSTNAYKPGASSSEEVARHSLDRILKENRDRRIFISTFSSNLWRLIHIIELAQKHQRRVHVLGYGMQKTLQTAQKLGIYSYIGHNIQFPEYGKSKGKPLLSSSDVIRSRDDKDVFIISGSQLEPGSALSRILDRQYGDLVIEEQDIVVFSSRTIPGHERSFIKAQGKILWQGGQIISTHTDEEIHVSGHGHSTDVDVMLSVIQPRFFVPIHGEYWHLISNARARTSQQIFLWENQKGCLLQGKKIHPFAFSEICPEIFIDSEYQPCGKSTIKQRQNLARRGVLMISGVYDSYHAIFAQEPEFQGYGIKHLPLQEEKYIFIELLKQAIDKYDTKRHASHTLDEYIAARFENELMQRFQNKAKVLSKIWLK